MVGTNGTIVNDEEKVYKELCQIVDEWIEIYKNDGVKLPPAAAGKKYLHLFN